MSFHFYAACLHSSWAGHIRNMCLALCSNIHKNSRTGSLENESPWCHYIKVLRSYVRSTFPKFSLLLKWFCVLILFLEWEMDFFHVACMRERRNKTKAKLGERSIRLIDKWKSWKHESDWFFILLLNVNKVLSFDDATGRREKKP